jgi:mono/diheme cytochrome c family protein
MKITLVIPGLLLAVAVSLALSAAPGTGGGNDKDKDKDAPAPAATSHAAQDDTSRLEGEKRFHSNCARCHAAPPKFSPRMAATIVRHMRVRATITDEDMRLITRYLAQ